MDRKKPPGKQPSMFLSQWNLKFSHDDSQHQSNKDNVSRVLLFSYSVVSNSLQPHGLQHTRLLCPSPSPGVCSNSCPLSWWYHPTISSSVPPLLLPSIFPCIRVFSSDSALHIRWPKYWRFSFSISPSNSYYSGLISFRIDWFDLLSIMSQG